MAGKDTKSKTTDKSSSSAKTTAKKPSVNSTTTKSTKSDKNGTSATKTSAPAKSQKAQTSSKPVAKSEAGKQPDKSKAKAGAQKPEVKTNAKATAQKADVKTSSAKPAKDVADNGAKVSSAKTAKNSAPAKEAKTSAKAVAGGAVAKNATPAPEKPAKGVKDTKQTKSEPARESAKQKSSQDAKKEQAEPKSPKKSDTKSAKSEQAKNDKRADVKQNKSKEPQKKDGGKKKEGSKSKSTANESPENDEKRKKMMTVVISAVAIVLMIAIVLGIVIGVKSCNKNDDGDDPVNALNYKYMATTPIGFNSETLGTVERVKPVAEIKDGGLPAYPQYGKNLSSVLGTSDEKVAARNALIRESNYLTATGTSNAGAGDYTWMDENGFLYKGSTFEPVKTLDSEGNHRQLYKHTASVGLYGGDVADDEPAIVKQITFQPRGYSSYSVTGVYAPAGEVIKIQISEKDMDATGGVVIHIGQALYNGQANNIWAAKNQMPRFPVILNTMAVNKQTSTYEDGVYTAYVGSFVGGPIYVRNTSKTVKVTISGGVRYSHFILGYTTPEEFEENAKSSAPYFDMEVWNYGVLHSGPKSCAKNFSYDDLYKAAVLWEKVSLVSTTNSKQGVVFIYDAFVAAGAAVAFPGRSSVNCPTGWMSSSLNYKGMVTSGAWGNFHEYHHNFQNYGVGDGGEVTNNGMTLVSYALFTKISSARSLSNYGASGLGDWNRYTSATWALEQAMRIGRAGANAENGNKGLALYATLLHNFGADNYIQSKVKQQKTGAYGQNYAGYLRAWQDTVHNNMSYYFNNILGAGLGTQYDNAEYPMFVPVASVYQTGRGYSYDGVKKYINTMQPYVIASGEEFTLDFRRYTLNSAGQYEYGSIVLPSDFDYSIKSISDPEFGELEKVEEGIYKYKPDPNNLRSGKMILTLALRKSATADESVNFEVEDVELVIELEQTHEKNKYVLNRTTYEYEAGKAPTDAREAYTSNYAGHINKIDADNINKVQNSNTDVWYNTTDDLAPLNTVVEVRGKLYASETGKYRIALRGRYNVALYVSLDGGKTYELAGYKNTLSAANGFDFTDENTFKDYELEAGTWVYFKEVMINSDKRNSFIGMGFGMFTPVQGVIPEGGGNGEVEGATEETISVKYATAYRETYEFQGEFTSDYFYKWEKKYTYADNIVATTNKTLVSTNYQKNLSWNYNSFPVENISDDKPLTYIHTGDRITVSDSTPLVFVMDLGEVKSVNRMTIYSQYRPNGDYMVPTSYNLYGSIDGKDFTPIGQFTNIPRSGSNSVVNFEETQLRYYRIEITKSTGRYVIIGEIQLTRIFELTGGDIFAPSNEKFSYKGEWDLQKTSSTFGNVFVGKKGSEMSFELEGSRMIIMSSTSFGTDFDVYVDGEKVDTVALKEDENVFRATYVSPDLGEGKHKITVVCRGEANIDSVITYA